MTQVGGPAPARRPSAAGRRAATMGGVSHVDRADPHNVFGEMFRRGPTESPDGGDRIVDPSPSMGDVDHEAPFETHANHVWARGGEGRADR